MSLPFLTLLQRPTADCPPPTADRPPFSLSDYMDGQKREALKVILDRVARTRDKGVGFTMGDLSLMLEDAFRMGAGAMAEGLATRENEKTLALLEEMEQEAPVTFEWGTRHPWGESVGGALRADGGGQLADGGEGPRAS